MPRFESIKLPQFPSRHDCTKCALHEHATFVGIPTVWEKRSLHPSKGAPALVCIGGAPSFDEDRFGQPWCGEAGEILKQIYLDLIELWDSTTVYYANAVRCRTGLGDPPPPKASVKVCLPYLLSDLYTITQMHERTVLLVLGSVATQALFGLKLTTAALRLNGRYVSLEIPHEIEAEEQEPCDPEDDGSDQPLLFPREDGGQADREQPPARRATPARPLPLHRAGRLRP